MSLFLFFSSFPFLRFEYCWRRLYICLISKLLFKVRLWWQRWIRFLLELIGLAFNGPRESISSSSSLSFYYISSSLPPPPPITLYLSLALFLSFFLYIFDFNAKGSHLPYICMQPGPFSIGRIYIIYICSSECMGPTTRLAALHKWPLRRNQRIAFASD